MTPDIAVRGGKHWMLVIASGQEKQELRKADQRWEICVSILFRLSNLSLKNREYEISFVQFYFPGFEIMALQNWEAGQEEEEMIGYDRWLSEKFREVGATETTIDPVVHSPSSLAEATSTRHKNRKPNPNLPKPRTSSSNRDSRSDEDTQILSALTVTSKPIPPRKLGGSEHRRRVNPECKVHMQAEVNASIPKKWGYPEHFQHHVLS
ncbi:hypothetical protein DFH09DRAFT_1072022 [Mycena vulgaris]|nr:hypothetical protein DFH09DRAFT_1072022 [Mycena vulgaris]